MYIDYSVYWGFDEIDCPNELISLRRDRLGFEKEIWEWRDGGWEPIDITEDEWDIRVRLSLVFPDVLTRRLKSG